MVFGLLYKKSKRIFEKKQWIMIKDDLDWKILEVLQQNSRTPYAVIGREIGLSASAVAERIQRLEDSGVIEGYATTINLKKAGLPLSAYISIQVQKTNHATFVSYIKEFPEVIQCSRVTGKDCLIMKCALKDSSHLANVIDRLAVYGDPTTLVVLSEVIRNGMICKEIIELAAALEAGDMPD